MSSIKVSPKHGVNPSMQQCFVCMQEDGIVLFGRVKGDLRAPLTVCFGHDSEPCDECKKHMECGVILISIDEGKSDDMKNPYRTGGRVVIKEDFIRRTFNPPELVEHVLRNRMAFVPDDAWEMLGLPELPG